MLCRKIVNLQVASDSLNLWTCAQFSITSYRAQYLERCMELQWPRNPAQFRIACFLCLFSCDKQTEMECPVRSCTQRMHCGPFWWQQCDGPENSLNEVKEHWRSFMTICELCCKELVAIQTRGKTRKLAGGGGAGGTASWWEVMPSYRSCRAFS